MKVKEYRIITGLANSLADFHTKCNYVISKGFIPIGGIATTDGNKLVQAFIKYG